MPGRTALPRSIEEVLHGQPRGATSRAALDPQRSPCSAAAAVPSNSNSLRKTPLRLVAALVLSAPAVLGCSSEPLRDPTDTENGGTPNPPVEPVPVDAFPERVARAMCQNAAPCCRAEEYGFDAAACEQGIATEYATWLAAFADYEADYDGAAAARCIALLESGDCAAPDWARLAVECSPIRGRLGAGEPCAANVECAFIDGTPARCFEVFDDSGRRTGTECRPDPFVPETYTPGGEGDACAASCAGAEGDVFCSPEVDTVDLGAVACFESDGVYCDRDVCAPLLTSGESCLLAGCEPQLFCDVATLTCAPRTDDGPCFTIFDCAETAFCTIEGRCEPKRPNGAPCQLSLDCASGACKDGGTCGPNSLADAATCLGIQTG